MNQILPSSAQSGLQFAKLHILNTSCPYLPPFRMAGLIGIVDSAGLTLWLSKDRRYALRLSSIDSAGYSRHRRRKGAPTMIRLWLCISSVGFASQLIRC